MADAAGSEASREWRVGPDRRILTLGAARTWARLGDAFRSRVTDAVARRNHARRTKASRRRVANRSGGDLRGEALCEPLDEFLELAGKPVTRRPVVPASAKGARDALDVDFPHRAQADLVGVGVEFGDDGCHLGAANGLQVVDGTVELETERTLDAPADVIHPLIADPAGVMRWWDGFAEELAAEGMADMSMEQGAGPATGPGATVLFKMGDTLAEEWTLVAVKPPTEVVWDVEFQMFIVRRTLQLTELPGGKTKVRWHEVGTFENPLFRWFTLMPNDSILENFQNAMGLLNKKAKAELGVREAARAAAEAGDDDSAGDGDRSVTNPSNEPASAP